MFLEPDEVNISVEARETLENYGSNYPDKLEILKSNCKNVILNARIYLIEMAKQFKQRFDFGDERLKFFSSISPYSFSCEYFRKLISSFKFLLEDKTELIERVYEKTTRTIKIKKEIREEDFDLEEFWISLLKKDKTIDCVKFVILLLC